MKPAPKEVIDKDGWLLVKTVDEKAEELNQWEIDFIDSIINHLLSGKWLSKKQRAKLNEITEEQGI